jgi:hypothetical protein
VFVYLDLVNGLRGPGYALSDPTGAGGGYRIPLMPGTYYVAARLRPGGRDVGPLQPGDLFGVAPQFPVVLKEGRALTIDVELVELPARERMARFQGKFASLFGNVVDTGGRPLAGFRACLYDNPQMINQPAALSEPTGADGKFALDTGLSGTFYLGARQRLGGAPLPGERVGFFRGAKGASIELAPAAQLRNLEIVVQEVR